MDSGNLSLAEKQAILDSTLTENGLVAYCKVSQTPYLMSIEKYTQLANHCELISNCLEKFLSLYANSTEVQSFFPELTTYRDLTCIRSSSKHSIHLARFDFIEQPDGKFKVVETNAGSPVFMKTSLVQVVATNLGLRPLTALKQPIDNPNFFPESLIELSKEVLGNPKPNVGALANLENLPDMNLYVPVIQGFGLNCVKVHHEDLKLGADGRLYGDNLPIDIVYQKLTRVISPANGQATCFLWDEVEDPSRSKISVYLNALKTQKIVVANHISSYLVAENKRTLTLLRRPEFQVEFTRDEREAIDELIPESYSFDHTNQDQFVNLVDSFVQNKAEWVIKSAVDANACSVWVGKECSDEIWNELVFKLPKEPFVIQRFVHQNETLVLTPTEEPTLNSMFTVLSIFIVRGKASGLYCRSAKTVLVSTHQAACIRPAWIVQ